MVVTGLAILEWTSLSLSVGFCRVGKERRRLGTLKGKGVSFPQLCVLWRRLASLPCHCRAAVIAPRLPCKWDVQVHPSSFGCSLQSARQWAMQTLKQVQRWGVTGCCFYHPLGNSWQIWSPICLWGLTERKGKVSCESSAKKRVIQCSWGLTLPWGADTASPWHSVFPAQTWGQQLLCLALIWL